MLLKNRDVVLSYIMTMAKYNFNIYEKRIYYRIVESLQFLIEGKKLKDKYIIDKTLFKDYIFTMPISGLLLNEKDKHHSRIKTALKRLNDKKFIYEDDRVWKPIRLVQKPQINKYDETIKFELQEEIVQPFLDFSKGFKKFELETAMSFGSIYAMRFYELFSGQKNPIAYKITDLKIMFQIENKYDRINDFFKKVIIPAQSELTKKSPYSFKYKKIKTGRKVTSIKFIPYYIPENRDQNIERKSLQKQVSPSWDLDKMVVDYLKQNFNFETKEIQNNIELLKLADEKFDLMIVLSELKPRIENVKNIQGYVIGTLKKKLKVG